MKYYRLKRGDYVQSGDELLGKDSMWKPVASEFFGKKYGYDLEKQQVPQKWVPIRRLVSDEFKEPGKKFVPQIDEQYGLEFEV